MSDDTKKLHSDFGGSVIGRVIACPGSVSLSATVPQRPSSSYAEEGTFAHALAEACLVERNFDASSKIGTEIRHPVLDSTKEVTEEMAQAVQVYLDVIHEELGRSEDAVLEIEQRFVLPISSAGEGEVFGANDALVYHPSIGRMVVFDYKHGQGVSVSAEDNAQLKFYAAGAALSKPDWNIAELELVIVQPRARDAEDQDIPGVKPWKMDTFELIEFVGTIEEAVAKAKAPNPAYAVGDHCRWCAAAGVCPAQQEQVVQQIGVDFRGVEVSPERLAEPKTMSVEEIGKLLGSLDVLRRWANQVEEFAFGLLQSGVSIPGYKLVEKVGRRKWIDNEEDIAAFLEMSYGIAPDDVFPRKLVTITEAERLIKQRVTDKTARSEALADMSLRYTLKDSSGLTMAPDTDRRDAVTAGAAADFAGVDIDG